MFKLSIPFSSFFFSFSGFPWGGWLVVVVEFGGGGGGGGGCETEKLRREREREVIF